MIYDGQYFKKLEEVQFMEAKHNLFSAGATEQLYEADEAPIMARLLIDMTNSYLPENRTFAQQYNYKHGVKKYGKKANEAALKEIQQQHVRKCFMPIAVAELLRREKEHAQEKPA